MRRGTRALGVGTLGSEAGFSLSELLVVIVILGMMMAAVFLTLDVSQKSYTRATSNEDAQLGARSAIERMVTEFRLIGSHYSGATNASTAITAATATCITFMGDIDADSVSSAGAEAAVPTGSTASGTLIPLGTTTGSTTGFSAGELAHIAEGATREVRTVASIAVNASVTLDAALSRTFAAGSVVRSVERVRYIYVPAAPPLPPRVIRDTGSDCVPPTTPSDDDTLLSNASALAFRYFEDDGSTETAVLADIREIEITLTTTGSGGTRRTMSVRVRPRSLAL